MQAQLWDRTPGYDRPEGAVLAYGPFRESRLLTNVELTSGATVDFYDEDYYPAARSVEHVLLFDIFLPNGVWEPCPPAPSQWRYLHCSGAGTNTLTVRVGFFPFPTGVSAPPRTFGSQASSCTPSIHRDVTRSDANRSATVGFFAQIHCRSPFAPQIQMVLDLYDRTPGQNDQPLTTRNSGSGTGTVTLASPPVTLYDRDYPKGSQAEVVIEAILQTTDGSNWTQCLAVPAGLRYARPCEGLNTNTLKIFVGTGNFPTGVKQPPLECKRDDEPKLGTIAGIGSERLSVVKVTPHVEYCGYFDWGTNSRVTEVRKYLPTQIEVLASGVVCNAGYFPDPPASDGLTYLEGSSGRFQVAVRFLVGPCDLANAGHYVYIDRVYRSDGTVDRSRDHEAEP